MTDMRAENNQSESRKQWAAPKLNKIDIEQITASGKARTYQDKAFNS